MGHQNSGNGVNSHQRGHDGVQNIVLGHVGHGLDQQQALGSGLGSGRHHAFGFAGFTGRDFGDRKAVQDYSYVDGDTEVHVGFGHGKDDLEGDFEVSKHDFGHTGLDDHGSLLGKKKGFGGLGGGVGGGFGTGAGFGKKKGFGGGGIGLGIGTAGFGGGSGIGHGSFGGGIGHSIGTGGFGGSSSIGHGGHGGNSFGLVDHAEGGLHIDSIGGYGEGYGGVGIHSIGGHGANID